MTVTTAAPLAQDVCSAYAELQGYYDTAEPSADRDSSFAEDTALYAEAAGEIDEHLAAIEDAATGDLRADVALVREHYGRSVESMRESVDGEEWLERFRAGPRADAGVAAVERVFAYSRDVCGFELRTLAARRADEGPERECGPVENDYGHDIHTVAVHSNLGCEAAEALLERYFNDPPAPPEGSGAFVYIDGWDCGMVDSMPGVVAACSVSGEAEEIRAVESDSL